MSWHFALLLVAQQIRRVASQQRLSSRSVPFLFSGRWTSIVLRKSRHARNATQKCLSVLGSSTVADQSGAPSRPAKIRRLAVADSLFALLVVSDKRKRLAVLVELQANKKTIFRSVNDGRGHSSRVSLPFCHHPQAAATRQARMQLREMTGWKLERERRNVEKCVRNPPACVKLQRGSYHLSQEDQAGSRCWSLRPQLNLSTARQARVPR